MALGAAGYLTKLIDPDRLIALLRPYQARAGRTRVLVVEDDPAERISDSFLGWSPSSGRSAKRKTAAWRSTGWRKKGRILSCSIS